MPTSIYPLLILATSTFWGFSALGQQVPNGVVVSWGKQEIPLLFYEARKPIDLSAGSKHAMLLRPDGTVVAWGGDDFGQASIPSNLTNVTQIAACSVHNLALKSDGTVVAWGD